MPCGKRIEMQSEGNGISEPQETVTWVSVAIPSEALRTFPASLEGKYTGLGVAGLC